MLFTPGISTGYWKARKTPSRARSSADSASRSLPLIGDAALGDLIAGAAGEHAGQRALAGAVRPHDRMHLAGADAEVDPLQDLAPVSSAHAGF